MGPMFGELRHLPGTEIISFGRENKPQKMPPPTPTRAQKMPRPSPSAAPRPPPKC